MVSREDGCFADKGLVSREGGNGQGGGAVGRGSDRIEGAKATGCSRGDQTCHQVHFQHGIFNNFCSTIGQFNKNLFNNRQFHQQHYSTIGLFNNFKFNIRQLNNSVMVNSTTKIFNRSRRVGGAESRG